MTLTHGCRLVANPLTPRFGALNPNPVRRATSPEVTP